MITAAKTDRRFLDGNMPKKRTDAQGNPQFPRQHPADLRWGTLAVDEMLDLHKTVNQCVIEIGAALLAAKKDGIDSVYLDGVTQLKRAAAMLDQFTNHLNAGLRKARRGD